MIRDQLRHFEESRFSQLLVQLEQWGKPALPHPPSSRRCHSLEKGKRR
jgi:hypothetical protein